MNLKDLLNSYKGFPLPWNLLRGCPCPKCGKKKLSYCDHPHAQGYKDYSRLQCLACKRVFRIVESEHKNA